MAKMSLEFIFFTIPTNMKALIVTDFLPESLLHVVGCFLPKGALSTLPFLLFLLTFFSWAKASWGGDCQREFCEWCGCSMGILINTDNSILNIFKYSQIISK